MATSRKSPAATSRSVAKKVPAKSKQTKSGSARSVVAKQSATKKSARTVQTSSAKGRVRALASPKKVAQGPKVVAKKTRAKSSPVPKTPMKKALAVKKSPAKAVSATKQAKKAPTTKTAAKQGATIKSPAKKAPAKKATVAKAPAKKVAATKSPVKKATPSKTAVAKKAPVAKATATKAPAAKATSSSAASKTAVAKKAPAPKIVDKPTEKAVSPKIVEKKAPPAKKVSPGYRKDVAFLERQKQALLDERAARLAQEQSQKQEAAALVEEMEPGDIQFDEESGEGGTLAVDREIHLELAAKQRLLVEEIDLALRKIALGTYGICERCENLIPKQRLTAIPEARICVPCSTGGLSRR